MLCAPTILILWLWSNIMTLKASWMIAQWTLILLPENPALQNNSLFWLDVPAILSRSTAMVEFLRGLWDLKVQLNLPARSLHPLVLEKTPLHLLKIPNTTTPSSLNLQNLQCQHTLSKSHHPREPLPLPSKLFTKLELSQSLHLWEPQFLLEWANQCKSPHRSSYLLLCRFLRRSSFLKRAYLQPNKLKLKVRHKKCKCTNVLRTTQAHPINSEMKSLSKLLWL